MDHTIANVMHHWFMDIYKAKTNQKLHLNTEFLHLLFEGYDSLKANFQPLHQEVRAKENSNSHRLYIYLYTYIWIILANGSCVGQLTFISVVALHKV